MKDYERFRDSLICSKNDDIDNAAFDVINRIAKDESRESQLEAVKGVLEALMPSGKEVVFETTKDKNPPVPNAVNANDLLENLKAVVAKMDIETDDDGEVEWEMEQIAEVTMAVEGVLSGKDIGVCHPFFMTDEDVDEGDENFDEDNDGILCCLSSDRCPYCPHNVEEG